MEALILLATPIFASWATEQLKRLKSIEVSPRKAAYLRVFALTLSFGGVVAGAVATGQAIPVAEVQTYIEAVLLFGATQVPYLFGKASGESK